MCSICGVGCARSKLVRKADGMFYCPDCQPGRDAVTLSRLNAQKRPVYRPRWDGPGMDGRGPYEPAEGSRVFSDEFSEEFA